MQSHSVGIFSSEWVYNKRPRWSSRCYRLVLGLSHNTMPRMRLHREVRSVLLKHCTVSAYFRSFGNAHGRTSNTKNIQARIWAKMVESGNLLEWVHSPLFVSGKVHLQLITSADGAVNR